MTKDELTPIDTSKYKITETGQVFKMTKGENEMTKDEMKDKISMALKDPVLQQGFEIICKENAELDSQMNRNKYCHSCVNATDRCFRKEIGCPCEKYKSYKDENAELKEKISVLLSCTNCPENKGGWICVKEYENKCLSQKIEFIKELEKENAELKQYAKALEETDNTNILHCMKVNGKLYKAKEIIKDYMTIVKGDHTEVCGVPEKNRTIYVLKLNEEAEQFIKDMEI